MFGLVYYLHRNPWSGRGIQALLVIKFQDADNATLNPLV
jgi:hypothetical protein